MAVYVDDMAAPFKPAHRPGRTYVMCHMIADSSSELFAMVDKIAVSRKWVQDKGTGGEHFDIAQSKRARAVRCGARQITRRQLGCMVLVRRKTGKLCAPEVAYERVRELMSSRELVEA